MTRFGQIGLFAAILTACGGPPAGGQATPANAGLARLHLYEVPAAERGSEPVQEAPEPGWIQVNGNASVQVAPDRARVAFSMETRAVAADQAAAANADAMDAVLRALRGASFEGLTLATYGYSLQPEYNATNNQRTREIVAYTVLNNVSATLEDVSAVGRVIDVAIGSGANRVTTISFFASDTEDARAEALEAAVRNAKSEAEVIARSLGHELGAPIEVSGGAQRPSPRAAEMADMSFRAAATPIEAGDQTVTASVSIRFALGPELGG